MSMENSLYNFATNINAENDNRTSRLKRKPMFDDRGNLHNGVRLSFEKGFGFNQHLDVNSAQSIDDNKIVYILGKQIVLYDMLTENQRLIDQFGQQQQITYFKYFKNLMLEDNIIYSLYAENKIYPTLIIKNFSKGNTQKYVMSHLEKEEKIIYVDLLNDYKHLCVLSELQNNFRYSLIDVSNKQVFCSQNIYFKVKGVIIPFCNDKIVLIYSDQQIYMIQVSQQIKPTALKLNKLLEPQQFIVEAITSIQNDAIIYLITNKGNLYSISIDITMSIISKHDKIFLGTYETVDQNGKPLIKHKEPSSICCNQYNILIGYYHIEQFTLIKICALNNLNSLQTIGFSCPFLHKIVKMTFAHQTMAVCIIVQVKQNDRYNLSIPIQSQYLKQKGEIKIIKQSPQNHLLPPGKIFPVMLNLLLHDTLVQTLRSPIQSILTSTLFVEKILDICLIPTKKLFLILSNQKKIKAIKYEHLSSTSFERMLSWEFNFNNTEFPTSLDTHPLTMNVAVGFKQGLKLYIICSQGLRSANIQFPFKNCENVRYSKYGHKLIVGTLNQLIIINPYQHKIINTIHFNSGYFIRQLAFLDKDLFIQGIFANGSSMIMNNQGIKLFEVCNKNNKCLASAFDSIFDIMAVSYPQSITKFYRDRGTQQFAVMWTYPYNITKIVIANEIGTIFMGTSLGKIKAHQWPFTDSMKFSKYFTEIQLHSAPITELKITFDYSLIISGAEDGTIFISKINAVSQGIPVNDVQILSSFKCNYKNYKTLFYMQPYLNTSTTIQNNQEQAIGQLQSDKSDFDTQYNDIIVNIQQSIEIKLKKEEQNKMKQFKSEMAPLQSIIDKLNANKTSCKEQITQIIKAFSDTNFQMQQKRLKRMRQLYKQTDDLNDKKKYYIGEYKQEIQQLQKKQSKQYNQLVKQFTEKQQNLKKECSDIEIQCKNNIINYKQSIKEQDSQAQIYKIKMMQEMQAQLNTSKEHGQKLRKKYNKLYHDNNNFQEKMKYFQQLMTQLQIDLQNITHKNTILRTEQAKLHKLLKDKDRQIFNEEKQVKQLITGNINNYTHEQYLKHNKEELMLKQKYLQGEISALDKKYNTFQEDFNNTSKQSKQLQCKIMEAVETINKLKQIQKQKNQVAYLRRYKEKQIQNTIVEISHKQMKAQQLKSQLKSICNTIDTNPLNQGQAQLPVEIAIQKRDHLIKQVVNTNNLRKIDDTIRRTIMIKLNRETVGLTCEVNQLRKEKKTLGFKIKELQNSVKDLKQGQTFKQNSYVNDLVPANISIIRKETSKHSSQKLLPFQLYHHNKSYNKSKNLSKEFDESSTQLPSLLKHSLSGLNLMENSQLYGVQQIIDDQIVNCDDI